MLRAVLLVLSAIVTISATIPYIIEVLKRKTKPRVVSWFNWAFLAGIAAAAALSAKQYPSAVLSLAGFIECLTIAILGYRFGDRKFESIDIICQAGTILGLVLWAIFNSPLVAIVASMTVDFIASLPTLRHIWRKPQEETRSVFILSAVGATLALAAVHHPKAAGLVVPIYIILVNVLNSSIFFITPNRRRRGVY